MDRERERERERKRETVFIETAATRGLKMMSCFGCIPDKDICKQIPPQASFRKFLI